MRDGWFETFFEFCLAGTPAVALFILWLISNHSPESVQTGTYFGIATVVAVLLLLLRHR